MFLLSRAIVCTVLLALTSTNVRAEDWPQFRGPTGQGLSGATGVPVEWDAEKNVAWKVKIPGKGWSSPVLAAGKLYLTSAVDGKSGSTSLHALCLDAADGKVLWDAEVFQRDAAQVRTMHKKNSPASPTPIVTGDRLYVHFGYLGTAALDLSSKVLWKQESLKFPPVHGNGGSPALVGDALIFNGDGASDPFIVALDAATGKVRWNTPRNTHAKNTFSFSTPLAIEVNGKTQVVSPGSGLVGAYDLKDGREIWRVRYGQGFSVVPRPVFAQGILVLVSSYDNAVTYAIRPEGAAGDVTDSHVVWTNRKAAPSTPSPLVVGNELYLISDGGIATCSDLRTGKVYWTERLDGNYSASPIYAEGRVYYQAEDGVSYVVKAAKTFELLSENDLGERSLASYAATDGALFIRTDHHLWKIAAQ